MAHDAILVEVEQLQSIVLACATGGGDDHAEYRRLRTKLMADASMSSRLPRFVHASRDLGQFWAFIKAKFGSYAERRQFIWDEFRPLIAAIEAGVGSPVEEGTADVLAKLDADHVRQHWTKALDRVANDPEGAITSARALIESVCKLILDAQKIEYDRALDLNKLYKQAARSLKLGPDQHSPQVFKQILTGCSSVVEGLAGLRNNFGDAHGQGARPMRPSARHAVLAVNLAGAMATFLLQTFEVHHGDALHAPPAPPF